MIESGILSWIHSPERATLSTYVTCPPVYAPSEYTSADEDHSTFSVNEKAFDMFVEADDAAMVYSPLPYG
jgi:hypothetical protein